MQNIWDIEPTNKTSEKSSQPLTHLLKMNNYIMKLITIDFWNTIYDSSGGKVRNDFRLRKLVESLDQNGIAIKNDEFDRAIKASWAFFNSIWKNEHRTPAPVETVKYFFEYLKMPADESRVNKVAYDFGISIIEHPPCLVEGVKNAIETLQKQYKLAIISDTGFSTGKMLRKLLEKDDIIQYFAAFSFSDETGVSKPHKIAFDKILNELKILPTEALHIGDIEATDIIGAKNIGMKAIRFSGDPTAKLTAENPKVSIADFEAFSWQDILDYLDFQ